MLVCKVSWIPERADRLPTMSGMVQGGAKEEEPGVARLVERTIGAVRGENNGETEGKGTGVDRAEKERETFVVPIEDRETRERAVRRESKLGMLREVPEFNLMILRIRGLNKPKISLRARTRKSNDGDVRMPV